MSIFPSLSFLKIIAIAEYPVEIEAGGGKGLASTRQVSSVAGSWKEAISYVLATRLRVAKRQNYG